MKAPANSVTGEDRRVVRGGKVRRVIYVGKVRCSRGHDDLKVQGTRDQGDGSTLRYMICRTCGERFDLIEEG